MVEMNVVGVAVEPNTNRPLVWLKDREQRIFLPITIGSFEATAIHMALYDEEPSRPPTCELLRSILDGMGVKVTRVLINALKEDVFFAEVSLNADGKTIGVDSRPSDALALALRTGAPVFVEDRVIQEAGMPISSSIDIEVEGVEGGISDRLTALRAELREAVAREQYEEAASLRDEIQRLEHQMR
ncbi:MAG: bifunctional nuclease family protein [Gemmatimonadetes bacterium]|nr:bifunctional nuclease family protein [Gemmatimonadota bacterium]